MYSIFTSVNKGNYNNTMKKFTKAVKENKQAIVKNRIKENLQTLQEEKQIHKAGVIILVIKENTTFCC